MNYFFQKYEILPIWYDFATHLDLACCDTLEGSKHRNLRGYIYYWVREELKRPSILPHKIRKLQGSGPAISEEFPPNISKNNKILFKILSYLWYDLKMTPELFTVIEIIMFTVPNLVTNSDEIQLRRSCCKINEGVFWRRRSAPFCIKIYMAPTSQIMPHLKFEKINRQRSLKTLMLNLRVV